MKRIDITGQRFGKLTVVEYAGNCNVGRWRPAMWRCVCDCGNETIVRSQCLRIGRTKSCGCAMHDGLRTHGHRKHPLYTIWQAMKWRCYCKTNTSYERYGGRGIKVCERWMNSFENFYADMGERPTPQHSIERIDNCGDYEPSNCKWATKKEQVNNRRSTHMIAFNGTTQSLSDWAKEIGMSVSGLHGRLKRGWSVEKSLTTPT